MEYKINLGCWSDIFAVPRSVVTEHIKLAKEDYIKVLLIILANSSNALSKEKISELSGVSEINLNDAISFWVERDIIKESEGEFIPCPERSACEGQKEVKTDIFAQIKEHKTEPSSEISVSENVKIKTREPARPSSFEISERINSTNELKWIVSETERMFGKLLSQSEIAVLVSMFDYAGISADVIIMIVEYCVSIDKPNMRFIEKTAYDWADKGIDNHKKIQAHITGLVTERNNETLIKSAFGIWDRNLTSKQKEFVSVWLEDWNFSIEMIKIAYEKCIDNTSKLSFPYINKVLLSWKEKNIKTPKQVNENEIAREKLETVSSTFNAKEFDDLSNYTVPNLSKKKLDKK